MKIILGILIVIGLMVVTGFARLEVTEKTWSFIIDKNKLKASPTIAQDNNE